ncbi:DNA-binding SARP family transcriptional activator [Arthrobacter sp. CAN_A212]|uniref:AfsR/SARP family transcriptional regulator n=1 Tax=unclassified Arthrobacter TaxID=235627 RepID=UPI001A350DCD|nr:BTAD domain-containing putative transcriptional regulator [Arthrobacter sp. CAN_C5]MBP2215431.1 DNA-binding SARP family transcriptional activator [Arthrobacter sp. CAN_C5]
MDATHQPMANRPGPAPVHLSIQIIGKLRVRRGNEVLEAEHFGGPKPRQILEILLLTLGTPVSKDRLVEKLWGNHPPAESMATLESYVSVLRRHLQPGEGKAGPLRTSNGGYVMDPFLVDLDLDRFNSLMRAVRASSPAAAYPLLQQALELSAVPLLADELRPEWAQEERALHSARVTSALILAAEIACVLHQPDDGVLWARRALDADFLNEGAWTALVSALEQSGRHAEGLQAYERCRRALDLELGCTPGPKLRDAQLRLLRATADGQSELAEVLSALLVLHGRVEQRTGRNSVPPESSLGKTVRTAGEVLSSFLLKALATS